MKIYIRQTPSVNVTLFWSYTLSWLAQYTCPDILENIIFDEFLQN